VTSTPAQPKDATTGNWANLRKSKLCLTNSFFVDIIDAHPRRYIVFRQAPFAMNSV